MTDPFITAKASPWNLPASITQCWCVFDTGSYQDRLFPEFAISFPESLRDAVAKRRAEHLAGRYCAHRVLSSIGHGNVPLGIGPQGSPQWPGDVKGSISHSRAWACALASTDSDLAGIGVDIENVVDSNTLEQCVELILVSEERPLLDLCDLDARTVFTLIFSLKESFYKAAHPTVGQYFGFDAVTVTSIDPRAQTLLFRLNETLHTRLPAGASFQASYRWLEQDTLATLALLPRDLRQMAGQSCSSMATYPQGVIRS